MIITPSNLDDDDTQTTRDALFDGALSIRQPARKRGYRVNVDALLLAGFASCILDLGGAPAPPPRSVRHAFDLGSGVGAVGLSLLHLGAAKHVTMIEIDTRLATLATRNAVDNGVDECADVVNADVKMAARDCSALADLVVCNPPYVAPGRGFAPAEAVRDAKYGDLDHFVDAARRVAGRRARVCFVYPAGELSALLTSLREHGLEPKRLRAVHGHAEDDARVVLVESCAAKPGGLSIEPPFVEMVGAERSAALTRLLGMKRFARDGHGSSHLFSTSRTRRSRVTR